MEQSPPEYLRQLSLAVSTASAFSVSHNESMALMVKQNKGRDQGTKSGLMLHENSIEMSTAVCPQHAQPCQTGAFVGKLVNPFP